VWNTAGNWRFAPLGYNFYGNTDVLFLMYDVTKPKTFMALDKWEEKFFEQEGVDPNTDVWIIGNKCDVEMDKFSGVRETQVKDRFPNFRRRLISVKNG
jgi:GTPase SAR1 family protein